MALRRTAHEDNIEKQMGGCMSGFFNLFDRNHLLSGKRLYPKRLPAPPVSVGVEENSSVKSKPLLREVEKPEIPKQEITQTSVVVKSLVPVTESAFEFKDAVKLNSPRKFPKEVPRLSLDSRAVTDSKGGLRPREIRVKTGRSSFGNFADEEKDSQRNSPSVVARLMGLEPLPSSTFLAEPVKKVELRRSASESRSREYRFDDGPSFLSPIGKIKGECVGDRKLGHCHSAVKVNRQQSDNNKVIKTNKNGLKPRNQNSNGNQRGLMLEKRSYYDTTDFFPSQPVTIYGEIERRLRMRGIDDSSKDLETLKHILEVMQLKGLLHSSDKPKARQNVVHDRRFCKESTESPIVLMKPARQASSPTQTSRRRSNSYNDTSSGEPSVSPRKERPGRGENRSLSPVQRRKNSPISVETQRVKRPNSPVKSPRVIKQSDQTVSRSPRRRKSTVEIGCHGDDVSNVSESSFSTCSHADSERWKLDEYKDGRNLLERCDKLLNSIAEITAISSSNSNSNSCELQQPSPVSVLDSSFYKEDESSPSPVKKRTIGFKDQTVNELEDEVWSPSSSTRLSKLDHYVMDLSDDSELSYVAEVVRTSIYFPNDTNLFSLIEKQCLIRGINRDNSKTSILQRKLIFDTITEILDRNRQLPPWKAASNPENGPKLDQIWAEFQKIREHGPPEDLFESVCRVLTKDLAGESISGWIDCPVEMSETVLDIERMIFKDLIGETIRDLAGKSVGVQEFRRKLGF